MSFLMFQTLSNKFSNIFDRLRSSGALTEEQIDGAMRDIRIALLEADVSLVVVKGFIEQVRNKAIGQDIVKSVTPAQMVIKIIHDELVALLSSPAEERALNLKAKPPVSIMMVGLQGSGKTTTTAKLALHLKNQGKKVLMVSLDIYRPAAQEQLEILGQSVAINSLAIIEGQNPIDITKRAIQESKLGGYDVVIYDTAGRLHIDQVMMAELSEVKSLVKPTEILLVVDSLTGQDAVNVATDFNKNLDITGFVLTRIDGDGRGGAALSIKAITGKPVKFLGAGEKVTALEEFHPERIASRILDMGDVVSLVEKAAAAFDEKIQVKTAERLKKGRFDLNDYYSQISSIKKMGGMKDIVSMIPGVSRMVDKIDVNKNEKMIARQEAIILSMTKKEKRNPDLINASRRKRIASGSGTSVQEVNKLLKQYQQVSDMVKKASRMDPKALMRSGIGKLFS
jgi:signal recognition particle subunit SRP54